MKKVLVLMLSVMLALPCLSLAADPIDLSGYSVDELIELKTAIVGELMERKEIKSANIPSGEYIIGEDIPAGTYSIASGGRSALVTVNQYMQSYAVHKDEGVGKIVLEDGDVFNTSNAIILTTYTGIVFE